jgi:lipid II:glycine glycyltransferase (peptidoglycan interpeptide bridge formation enzyme)
MKQKTRYNIRLAEKKAVTLRIGKQEDFACCIRCMPKLCSRRFCHPR